MAFSERIRTVPIALIGTGKVGCEVLRQLIGSAEHYRDRYALEFRVSWVSDSTQSLAKPETGFRTLELERILEVKQRGGSLNELPRTFATRAGSGDLFSTAFQPGLITIDCTASAQTTPLLLEVIRGGGKVVLANKKPLVGECSAFHELTASPALCRWETTVASCLPIISIVNRMIASGDEINSISGILSGTMAYLFTQIEEGTRFSEALKQAIRLGYTEPDPREDLLGRDQARKALILARTAGWNLELEDIAVTGLLPGRFDGLTLEATLEGISDLDQELADRVEACSTEETVLRYGMRIIPKRGSVGLMKVSSQSPIGLLRGNNNLVQVESRTFSHPLVVQGRGSGPAATGSGILSDLVELAFTSSEDQLQEE